MVRLSISLGALALALPAAAEEYITADWLCSFSTECLETEACVDTAYDVEISYEISQLKDKPGEGAGSGEITDVTATKRAVVVHDNGAFTATALDMMSEETILPQSFQVFATADGSARLVSVVTAVPLVTTYHGRCTQKGS